MKTGISIGSVLFVVAVLIGVVQLWFTPWRPDIFLKLELTVGAAFLIVVVICFVIKEFNEDKANRDGDHLD
jgi:phosphotransferase system  glucose/maltose/N-acetylglucosamine-specific IIC component